VKGGAPTLDKFPAIIGFDGTEAQQLPMQTRFVLKPIGCHARGHRRPGSDWKAEPQKGLRPQATPSVDQSMNEGARSVAG
jgi:hypothetical protein